MITNSTPVDRADQVCGHNDDLDRQLRALVDRVPADQLRHDPGDGEWTLAENLAHLGEFPHYFARELSQMLAADHDVEVGRTHEHPERNEAIAAATGKDRDELVRDIDGALGELAHALQRLSDDDLQRVFTNRKYGPEPLTAYLQRYVLGHKAAHVDQLHRTLPPPAG